jgi:hypothetical protein
MRNISISSLLMDGEASATGLVVMCGVASCADTDQGHKAHIAAEHDAPFIRIIL